MSSQEDIKSIKQWMEVFSEIYSAVDSCRTPEQIWIANLAHASSLGESIRLLAFRQLMKLAARYFCWFCSFINKCNTVDEDDIFSISETLCGIVSFKYPMRCGHCYELPCKCDPLKMDKERNKSSDYIKLLDYRSQIVESFENYSIDTCLKVFNGIYGGRIHIQSLETIGFHFLEEVGEAAVAIRSLSQLKGITKDSKAQVDTDFIRGLTTVDGILKSYTNNIKTPIKYASRSPVMLKSRVVDAKMGLIIELADTFSWFCAILNKLKMIADSIEDEEDEPQVNIEPLEDILNGMYIDPNGNPMCPTCKKRVCKCVFFN